MRGRKYRVIVMSMYMVLLLAMCITTILQIKPLDVSLVVIWSFTAFVILRIFMWAAIDYVKNKELLEGLVDKEKNISPIGEEEKGENKE